MSRVSGRHCHSFCRFVVVIGCTLSWLLLLLEYSQCVQAFVIPTSPRRYSATSSPKTTTLCSAYSTTTTTSPSPSPSSLSFAPPQQTTEQKARRKELLKRKGNHFQLDKGKGTIEFGAAVDLVTNLVKKSNPERELIEQWLCDQNGKALAQCIWDPQYFTELVPQQGLYQLQTMPLQFVTLQLQPTVKVQMWTQPSGKNKSGRVLPPIFKIQSISFDPYLQLLPSMITTTSSSSTTTTTTESMGLVLEVVGDLRPTVDGKGIMGKLVFQTKGNLPPPLRLIPDSVLQFASHTINDAILQFATQSFETRVQQKYQEYKQQQQAKTS